MREKLLFLGVDTSTRWALMYARSIGVHTIVTDYKPLEESPEKQMADEFWMVDVTDPDELERRCREEKVTGIFAGNHELCLDMVQELTGRLGLPFYASPEGWSAARDKGRFKENCLACGLDVPKLYPLKVPFQQEVLDQVEYPVIVKPVDSCASKGVSVCWNQEELRQGYEQALLYSETGNILVEDYVEGEELTISYVIEDGKAVITHIMAAVPNRIDGKKCFFGVAALRPQYVKEYLQETSDGVQALFEHMGCCRGIAFLQAIRMKGKYYFFEMGYRIDGIGSWKLVQQIYGFDPVKWMVDLSLNHIRELPKQDLFLRDEKRRGILYLVAIDSGTIAAIKGLEEVKSMEGVNVMLERFRIGDSVTRSSNMAQTAYYITISGDDIQNVIEKLHIVNDTLQILNENGVNMLIPHTFYDAIIGEDAEK